MRLTILFGQRECRYDGEYLPEALEVADEITVSDNPSWLDEQEEKYVSEGEFEILQWVDIDFNEASTNAITERFTTNLLVIGEVK